MRMKLNYVAPLLAAGAAAVAIAAAPAAAAAPDCIDLGPGTQCQSPGNVQINVSPPPIESNAGVYGPFFYYDRGHGGR